MPVICPPLYFAMGGRRNTTGRMHFAARDDMFVPGSSPGSRRTCRCERDGSSTVSASASGSRA